MVTAILVLTGCVKQPTQECKQAKTEYIKEFLSFVKASEEENGYNYLLESTARMCETAKALKANCEYNEDVEDVLTMCKETQIKE